MNETTAAADSMALRVEVTAKIYAVRRNILMGVQYKCSRMGIATAESLRAEGSNLSQPRGPGDGAHSSVCHMMGSTIQLPGNELADASTSHMEDWGLK